MYTLSFPAGKEDIAPLHAGDTVFVSGTIYTARDAAHKRLVGMIERGEQLPIELSGACIYYCGPCPAPPGAVIGSCGPTSALRMDAYAPLLYEKGVAAVIAKGPVAPSVRESIAANGCAYLCAAGGAGALIAQCVKRMQVVAFEDLGTESIKKLEVENLPVIVGIDSEGTSLFRGGEDA